MNISVLNSGATSSKIVVKLFSYDSHLIEQAIFVIRNALAGSGVMVKGPIPIPTRKKVFTVNRSPHVDKKSREHFEIITYIKIIELKNCDSKAVNCLLGVCLPNGVEIKIRYFDN